MRTCAKCGVRKPLTDYHRNKSGKDGRRELYKIYQSNYSKNRRASWTQEERQRDRDYHRNAWLLRKYGISVVEYEKLLVNQDGVCAICHLPPDSEFLVVDHNHLTGKIRGLLHRWCNSFIGLLQDDPKLLRAAADYLEGSESN